jgi:CLIP-associating protein 1/2
LREGPKCAPILLYPLGINSLFKVPDAEAIISTLKACLKVSHQHLTTAAVSVIPPLLPLIIASGQQNHRPAHQRSLSNSTSTSSTAASIDAFNLRQALTAFLTPGGLFERLGDNREKPRDKARESLVLLGGYAFKFAGGSAFASKSTSSKGPETPLATFERFMKESGFGSKVWRIREQVRSTGSLGFILFARVPRV